MKSPILEYLASYGVDPAYIMIGLSAAVLLLLFLQVINMRRMKKLYKRYYEFMRGKNMESMEEILIKQFTRMDELEASSAENNDSIMKIMEDMKKFYQKLGLVKYDAFRELSGNLSYSLALLDQNNDGIIISSMYSREGSYSYAKKIIQGKSSINLSEEEKKALQEAMNEEKISE